MTSTNCAMISGLMINRKLKNFRLGALLGLSLLTTVAAGQKPVPHLWSQVADEASVLSASTRSQLEATLRTFADTTTNQVAVLIIQSLDGEVLEDFSLKVAMENGLGQKDRDNGVLLLIAIDDRKMRIEVGYGLEGVLTDAICSQIIRNEIAPNFRRQDYDQGVTDGVNAILSAIGGEYAVEDDEDMNISEGLGMTWQEQLMIGIFVFSILGIFTFFAIMTKGGVGWFLYVFLIPFYAAFPGAIFGWSIGFKILIGYLVGVAILKIIANMMGWSRKASGGSGGGGGWSSGSGWSSGGSSSGGFSGGGGSFGGGGSSGGW